MIKKRILFFVVFLFSSFFFFCEKTFAKKFSPGINLDCARTYFSLKELKSYIDFLSEYKDSYLQLHLTDNENVGISCDFLGQTEHSAIKKGGSFVNPFTGKKFLSKKEIKSLLSYSKKKKVEIVPEINAPAHIGGFLRLANAHFGSSFVSNIAKEFDGKIGELDLSKKESISFIKKIYAEYSKLFKGCKYFHIGGDEVFFSSKKNLDIYLQEIIRYIQKKGFTVRLWNDALTKKNRSKLSKKIEITYWSFDGDTENKTEKNERRSVRASLPSLQNAGFRVLNYNSYYLYFIPSLENTTKESLSYMIEDLKKNWRPEKWDGTKETFSDMKNLIGSCISVWNEDANGVSKNVIFNQVKALFRSMVETYTLFLK